MATKILVVDDDHDQAEILHSILEADDRDITICTKAREALHLIEINPYDIIFTDISMPEVDGIQIIQYTKKHSPNTELIPITAFGDWGIYSQTLKLGAKEFVNKPYNIQEIHGLMKKFNENRRIKEGRAI
ncbi:MAG: response regulator [Chlamydiae bacterium]|nr:response regulator [Chlamydiota bacterium]MBI3277030.1 response regulator [Chlamydiota bacterium]